jgi:hypothetical protein
MKVEYRKLAYTFIVYIILIFINHKININKTLYISNSSYIQDYIIGLFFISFIIYIVVYIVNIILKNDTFNSESIMSTWNQINTNGSLFVILFMLYFKVMPLNVITVILLLLLIIIYYPIIEYTNNYILNTSFVPNLDDLSRAIRYTNDLYLKNNSSVKYYIGLNESNPSEIIINFKGTDIYDMNDNNTNVNIKTTEYTKDYATDPNIIKELTSSVGIHSGYFQQYLSVKYDIYNICKELLNKGAKKIFISGYSLGGAMSTICAFDFHANLNTLNITADNINTVIIASPPIGNHDFVNLYNKYVINSVRLVHLNDPIPRITDWLYEHTKNEYIVYSKDYSYYAHSLATYDYCIKYNNNLYSYVSRDLLIYTIIFICIIYYVRKYYTQDIVSTRHF